MFSPTVFQIEWKTSVEPVKWIAGEVVARQHRVADRGAAAGQEVDDARRQARLLEQLQRPVRRERGGRGRLPEHDVAHQRPGCEARFAPIAVKLNGLIAKTKPSSGRYSIRFQTPGEETGCSS